MSQTIRLIDRDFPIVQIRAYPQRYAKQLEAARSAIGHAVCNCGHGAKVVIRKMGHTYFLAAWPSKDGVAIYKHSQICEFYRDEVHDKLSAAQFSESLKPCNLVEPGRTAVFPDFSLVRITKSTQPQGLGHVNPPKKRTPGIRKTGLLALLYALFNSAGFTKHIGGDALVTYSIAYAKLKNVATTYYFPKYWEGNYMLSDITFIPTLVGTDVDDNNRHIESEFSDFEKYLQKSSTPNRKQTGIFIGELRSFVPTKYGYMIRSKWFSKPIYCTNHLFDKLAKQFNRELGSLNSPDNASVSHLVSICHIEINDSGNLQLINAAFALMSKHYIPCDSMHEVHLANTLCRLDRTFEKPISTHEGLMPDFVLRDGDKPIYMEVWGMNHDTYIERKTEKIAIYRERNMGLWEWDAVNQHQIPLLPERSVQFIHCNH